MLIVPSIQVIFERCLNVISRTHATFWTAFAQLPIDIQHLAKEKYLLWLQEPFHISLHFKHLGRNVWSVRINKSYRALGRRRDGLIVWFWIGTHDEYERLIAGLV